MTKRRGLSPVQRTIRHLRNDGTICDVVERWLPYAGEHGKKVDCFGFGDLLALEPSAITMVQCCGQDFKAHFDKILHEPNAVEWLKSGQCPVCGHQLSKIHLIGWRKIKKKRGGKQMVWAPRDQLITLEDFEETDG